MATTKRRTYTGRNTGMFYALIGQLPGYEAKYKEVIKEGVINEFYEIQYGKFHGRELRLSTITDTDYRHLLKWLREQVSEAKTREKLQDEAIRKNLIHQILKTFTRIGVYVTENFDDVNYHILRIPYSKGRIIPKIPTEELPGLLGAVRGYCDGIKQQQKREQQSALKN